MDTIEYQEKVTSKVVKSFAIATSIIWICVSILIVKYSIPLAVVTTLPLVLVALLCANFYYLNITITSKELVVAFGRWNEKRFFLQEIESYEQIKKIKKYAGLGIRLGFDGSVAYLTSFGNAVKINRVNKTPFIFSTNQPDKICHIISTKQQQTTL